MSHLQVPARPVIIASDEHGKAFLALGADGTAVDADWSAIRAQAVRAHRNAAQCVPLSERQRIAAVAWALRNPGVAP